MNKARRKFYLFAYMARWSSGQDAALSRRKQGFDSPMGHQYLGTIAQLGEHLPYKQGVTGSSPVSPTIYINAAW